MKNFFLCAPFLNYPKGEFVKFAALVSQDLWLRFSVLMLHSLLSYFPT